LESVPSASGRRRSDAAPFCVIRPLEEADKFIGVTERGPGAGRKRLWSLRNGHVRAISFARPRWRKIVQRLSLLLDRRGVRREAPTYSGTDVLGNEYDFVLRPLPASPRRANSSFLFAPMVERWGIAAGDLVTGRPPGRQGPCVFHAVAPRPRPKPPRNRGVGSLTGEWHTRRAASGRRTDTRSATHRRVQRQARPTRTG